MGKRDVDRESLADVQARLKEIDREVADLRHEENDLVQLRAQLAFAESNFKVGQRYTLKRGGHFRGRTPQLRTVEVVGGRATQYTRRVGFTLLLVTIKKGTGERGEVFELSPYDWQNLAPIEAAS